MIDDAITAAVRQAVEPLTVELRRLTDEVAALTPPSGFPALASVEDAAERLGVSLSTDERIEAESAGLADLDADGPHFEGASNGSPRCR